ncbi:MAG: MucB/RseB C-terminal domain-containing protein [Thiogranum sp.]|nr:MucB/RseB C-terminal domain-containing protein [Thiogranum sp.]
MRRLIFSVFWLLPALLISTGAAAQSARDWLERMSTASQTLNYSGIFVYQHQGQLEAMQIVHAMDESGERERLVSLTGPEREVLRDNRAVTCILGDRQSVLVNKSQPRAPFPLSFPRQLMELEQHYTFDVLDEDRVAGLNCRVVAVQPRDQFRYGRRLCVHDASHLLLRSEVTGTDGRTVEQMMFTSVEFPEKILASALSPQLDGADFTWQREPEQQPQIDASKRGESRWQISEVPDGFMLVDHTWHRLSGGEPGVEHWVYSDGLASLSVYVEESQNADEAYGGVTRRGALNAYGKMIEGYYVTVIGEVPRRTVELVGKSVESRQAAQ